MPDFGELSAKNHPYTTPALAPLYPSPPWKLDGAQVLQLSFETDKEMVMQWAPTNLTRTIPPYAHLVVAHYPSSPVGPFSVAHQFVVTRYMVMARAFSIQTIVDNADALAALREVWGFPAKLGKVTLDRQPDVVTATVERPAGMTLAKVQLTDIESIAPSEIRYDAMLNLRVTPSVQDGKGPSFTQVAQIDPTYSLSDCYRGRGEVTYPARSEADPWSLLAARYVICCTFAVSDTELPFARYVLDFP